VGVVTAIAAPSRFGSRSGPQDHRADLDGCVEGMRSRRPPVFVLLVERLAREVAAGWWGRWAR
jgi:hypothetical protein